MSMKKMRPLLLAALLASFPSWSLVAEEAEKGDGYVMVWSSVSEIGQHVDTSRSVGDGSLIACNVAKKSQVVPRVVPRGLLLSPGGNSYEWTITAVSCKPESRTTQWVR